MSDLTPETRQEVYLDAISDGEPVNMTPITREEIYLNDIAGKMSEVRKKVYVPYGKNLITDSKPLQNATTVGQSFADYGWVVSRGDNSKVNVTEVAGEHFLIEVDSSYITGGGKSLAQLAKYYKLGGNLREEANGGKDIAYLINDEDVVLSL